MKYLLFTLTTILVFGGCSVKEFNAGVDSVSNDISKAFNDSKDNSSN